MIRISWTAKERNENIRRKLRINENIIVQTIAKQKLRLFGHIQKMDSSKKLKVVVQGERDKCTRKTVKNMFG